MQLSFALPVLVALVFGLVVAAIELLIGGAGGPWPVRTWLARAWLYACFCYVILFGVIRV
jgi:hypothetical protein